MGDAERIAVECLRNVSKAYKEAKDANKSGEKVTLKEIQERCRKRYPKYVLDLCLQRMGVSDDVKSRKSHEPKHVEDVYESIRKFNEKHRNPSIREISQDVGISLSMVHGILMYLAVDNRIEYYAVYSRSIRVLTEEEKEKMEEEQRQVVLG